MKEQEHAAAAALHHKYDRRLEDRAMSTTGDAEMVSHL